MNLIKHLINWFFSRLISCAAKSSRILFITAFSLFFFHFFLSSFFPFPFRNKIKAKYSTYRNSQYKVHHSRYQKNTPNFSSLRSSNCGAGQIKDKATLAGEKVCSLLKINFSGEMVVILKETNDELQQKYLLVLSLAVPVKRVVFCNRHGNLRSRCLLSRGGGYQSSICLMFSGRMMCIE